MDRSDLATVRRENDKLRAELAAARAVSAACRDHAARLEAELESTRLLTSRFLASVSHDLRTPLTSIIGYTTLLLRERPGEQLTPRQRNHADRAITSARKLASLVNDLFEVAAVQGNAPAVGQRELDLRDVLEAVHIELSPLAADRGLSLELDISPDVRGLTADGERLSKIARHLLRDAIEHALDDVVTLHASRHTNGIALAVRYRPAPAVLPSASPAGPHGDPGPDDRRAPNPDESFTVTRLLVEVLGGHITIGSAADAGILTVELPVQPSTI